MWWCVSDSAKVARQTGFIQGCFFLRVHATGLWNLTHRVVSNVSRTCHRLFGTVASAVCLFCVFWCSRGRLFVLGGNFASGTVRGRAGGRWPPPSLMHRASSYSFISVGVLRVISFLYWHVSFYTLRCVSSCILKVAFYMEARWFLPWLAFLLVSIQRFQGEFHTECIDYILLYRVYEPHCSCDKS